jgi:hypothetical protein
MSLNKKPKSAFLNKKLRSKQKSTTFLIQPIIIDDECDYYDSDSRINNDDTEGANILENLDLLTHENNKDLNSTQSLNNLNQFNNNNNKNRLCWTNRKIENNSNLFNYFSHKNTNETKQLNSSKHGHQFNRYFETKLSEMTKENLFNDIQQNTKNCNTSLFPSLIKKSQLVENDNTTKESVYFIKTYSYLDFKN